MLPDYLAGSPVRRRSRGQPSRRGRCRGQPSRGHSSPGGGVTAVAFAFAAGALGTAGLATLAGAVAPAVRARAPRLAAATAALTATVVRAGREGRDPGALERRRLLVAGAIAALAAGTLIAGPRAGVVAAIAGPFALSRVLRARRERYRIAVEEGAAEIAIAMSDALAGGRSLRGAVGAAARSLAGPPGRELRRVHAELELGARTEDALEAMRARIRGHGVDTVVAAALLQREAGGGPPRAPPGRAPAAGDTGGPRPAGRGAPG